MPPLLLVLLLLPKLSSQKGTLWKCCELDYVLDDWYNCQTDENAKKLFFEKTSMLGVGPRWIKTLQELMGLKRRLNEHMVANITSGSLEFKIQDFVGHEYGDNEYLCVDIPLAHLEDRDGPPLIVLSYSKNQTEGFISKCCPEGQVLEETEQECVNGVSPGAGWIPPRHVLSTESFTPTGLYTFREARFPLSCPMGSHSSNEVASFILTNGSAMIEFGDEDGNYIQEVIDYDCVERIAYTDEEGLSDPVIFYCSNTDHEYDYNYENYENQNEKENFSVSKCCNRQEIFSISEQTCVPDTSNIIEPRTLFSEEYVEAQDQNLSVQNASSFVRSYFKYGPTCDIVKLEKGKGHVVLTDNHTLLYKGSKKSEASLYREYCIDSMEDSHGDTWPGIILCSVDKMHSSASSTIIDEVTEDCRNPVWLDHIYTLLELVSIVCLVLTITVYSLLPSLNSMHGRIIISNSVSIILVSTSVIISRLISSEQTSGTVGCTILGYFIYYSSMSMFLWMSIMNGDILFSFIRPSAQDASSVLKKFLVYSAVGWFGSLVLSLVLLILDLKLNNSSPYKPNIGKDACFIHQETQKLVMYFYLPVLVIMLANIIMFTIFVTKLRAHKNMTKGARISRRRSRRISHRKSGGGGTGAGDSAAGQQNKDNYKDIREQAVLFTKMFLVLGILWIFECIHHFAHADDCKNHANPLSEVVFKFFDIMNELRGFFIFLIFVCKKTIWTQIKLLPFFKRFGFGNKNSVRAESGRRFPGVIANSLTAISEVLSNSATDIRKLFQKEQFGDRTNKLSSENPDIELVQVTRNN